MLAALCALAGAFPVQTPAAAASTARWLVHEANWGYVALGSKGAQPKGSVLSFSDGPTNASTGRLFFYAMSDLKDAMPASLTLSVVGRLPAMQSLQALFSFAFLSWLLLKLS